MTTEATIHAIDTLAVQVREVSAEAARLERAGGPRRQERARLEREHAALWARKLADLTAEAAGRTRQETS